MTFKIEKPGYYKQRNGGKAEVVDVRFVRNRTQGIGYDSQGHARGWIKSGHTGTAEGATDPLRIRSRRLPRAMGRAACEPDLSLSWFDCARLSQAIREESPAV